MRSRRFLGSLLLIGFLLLAVAGGLLAMNLKKGELAERFRDFISERFQEAFGLAITMESVESNIFGYVYVRGLRAGVGSPEPDVGFLMASDMLFRYRLWDFLRGDFTGGVHILIVDPILYVDVPVHLVPPSGIPRRTRMVNLLSQLIMRVAPRSIVKVRNARLARWREQDVLATADGEFHSGGFEARIRLEHLRVADIDLSSDVWVKGLIPRGQDRAEPEFALDIRTERTIVNFHPLDEESRLSVRWTKDEMRVLEADLLGGLGLEGVVGLEGEGDAALTLTAQAYPLSNFDFFRQRPPDQRMEGRMDAWLMISGSLVEPHVQGDVLIREGQMGKTAFKNIQLTLAGVPPELRVSESRIVLVDGSVMNFAKDTVQVRDLFEDETYTRLVRSRDQDVVVWGDWSMRRAEDEKKVSLERGVIDDLRLRYESVDPEEAQHKSYAKEDEVELEYSLSESDSLKLELKKDEEFIGIQKKARF